MEEYKLNSGQSSSMLIGSRLSNDVPSSSNRPSTSSDDSDSRSDDEDYIINHLISTNSNQRAFKDRKTNHHEPLLPSQIQSFQPTSTKPPSVFHLLRPRTLLIISLAIVQVILLLFWLGSSTQVHKIVNQFTSVQVSTLDLNKLSMEEILGGRFQSNSHSISWLEAAGEGVYSEITPGGIILFDLKTNSSKTLMDSDDLRTPTGSLIFPRSFTVSSDLRYVLVSADTKSQWRHSTFANYWIFDTTSKRVTSLRPQLPIFYPLISIARWSPVGHSIAYVLDNDIYLISSPAQVSSPLRITTTGTSTVFNGICDWVYEEEVFEASTALWWSPDAKKLVWLTLDESEVHDYELTVYNPTSQPGKVLPYKNKKIMKYPKPGFKNPVVTVKMFDMEHYQAHKEAGIEASIRELKLGGAFGDEDRIVMEVAWVSDHELIVREINRIATREKTCYFDFKQDTISSTTKNHGIVGRVVMDIDFVELDGGWVEPGQKIVPVRANTSNEIAAGYLDIRINPDGFQHVAYFSPADSNQPVFLTSGPWEVDGNIKAINLHNRQIYFIAANPSMERHLYSTSLPTQKELELLRIKGQETKIQKLTSAKGYYQADFSANGGFYLLSYGGPLLPWQKIVKTDDPNYHHLLEDNSALNQTLNHYALPRIQYGTVKNSLSQDMNVQEIRPPNMDLSGRTKYPVLFKVYGGPNSQTASTQFGIDWNHYLASELDYIVVFVDGRGTGFKGRKYRVGVRNQLGKIEAADVAAAAQHYAKLKYVDKDRIGVWGWSYGGYLTCKVAESYSEDFSMALAVAPVIDWKYYDSIYTERYMSTPQLNPEGYKTSSVLKMEGFKNLSFSLAHGSADDNVHYLNSAELLDRLTGSKVRGFQFRMFTDSDHRISMRGAYPELMQWMTDFLLLHWGYGKSKDHSKSFKH